MVNRLRFVSGQQTKLLRDFLRYNNLSINSAAKLLSVGKTTFKNWLGEKRTLPENTFSSILKMTPSLKIYKDKIEANLPENWGKIRGGKARINKISNISGYLKTIRKIKDKKRLETSLRLKQNMKIENPILNELKQNKIDLKCILATCLLTDGSLTIEGNSYRIAFYAKDIILKDFVNALLFELSSFIPTEIISKKGVYAIRINDYELSRDLLTLSPNYKTSPNLTQSKISYLKEAQPSLKFLKNTDKNTLLWCIRSAFSTDGSISISKRSIVELNLSCYHPTLAAEWIKLLKDCGIVGSIGKSKASWCGISGVRIYDRRSIKKFADFGGFLPGVKISGKSKRYKGLEKNTVLQTIVGP